MKKRNCHDMRQQRRQRRGVALLLVIAIVAVASIMGMAMLSTASLQAQVGSNAKDVALADSAAEAGLEYATHKLLEMTERDVYWSRYWTSDGAKTITFGGDWNASAEVSVRKYSSANPDLNSTNPIEQYYEITSTSSVTTPSGNVINRTLKSRVNVDLAFQPKHAIGIGSGMTLPLSLRVKGDIRAGGTITLLYGGASKIDGIIYAKHVNSSGLLASLLALISSLLPADEPSPAVPTTVKDYRAAYTHDDVAGYMPQEISLGTDRSTPVTLNLQPSESNPAGIFYVNGKVTLGSNTRIRGTLYVTGELHIKGQDIDIRAEDGYPAVVAKDKIVIQGQNREADIRGLVWAGGGIYRNVLQSAAGSELNIHGSLQLPATAAAKIDVGTDILFLPPVAGSVYVEYAPEYVNVPDFADADADAAKKNRTPRGVQVLDYGLPL